MKKVLLLTLSLLLVANVAMAGRIRIYSDATATSCYFSPGFNPNVYIIEQFSTGSTGIRFKLDIGANQFFGFNTPFVPVGSLTTDLSLAYGLCLSGSIILGTAIMSLTSGQLRAVPADGFAFILYTDCVFAELPATGGEACVLPLQTCCIGDLPVESSTWGKVKSLYH